MTNEWSNPAVEIDALLCRRFALLRACLTADVRHQMRIFLLIVAGLSSLLAGCGNLRPYTNPYPNLNWREDLDTRNKKPRLIAQVCLSTEAEAIRFATLERGPIRSMDSAGVKRTGTTSVGQSIFETYTAFPEELMVDIVRINGEKMQYVFSTEGIVPRKEWSDWLDPLFATEDRDFFWRALHDKSYTKSPYIKGGPKIRYILMPFNDYLQRVRLRRNGPLPESIPPC